MIYYCVKTNEYLKAIINIVSNNGFYYKQMDININKAESVINKFKERYNPDITPRKKTDYLHNKKLAVFDLVILYTQSLSKAQKIRLCILATLPEEPKDASDFILKSIGKPHKTDYERFYDVRDAKTRFTFDFPSTKGTVYELVKLPYSTTERKTKGVKKSDSWTYRLHRDYIKLKRSAILKDFKNAQATKQLRTAEFDILPRLAGFRGVRDCVFELNSMAYGLSGHYLGKTVADLKLNLALPPYMLTKSRLTHSFSEMVHFIDKPKNSP